MVVRSGKPDLVPKPLSQAANQPPYPTTPSSEHVPELPLVQANSTAGPSPSPGSHVATLDIAKRLRRNSDFSDLSASDWEDSDLEQERKPASHDIPQSLKIGAHNASGAHTKSAVDLPAALRVGPPEGAPRKEQEAQQSEDPKSKDPKRAASLGAGEKIPVQSNNPNNPYLRMQNTGYSQAPEGGPGPWGDFNIHRRGSPEPVELPSNRTPVDETSPFSDPLSPSHHQPPLIPVSPGTPSIPHPHRNDSTASSAFDPGMDISSLDAFTSRSHGMPTVEEDVLQHRTWQEQQAWEQETRFRKERELAAAHERALLAEQERRAEEEWYEGERAQMAGKEEPSPPQLPPRRSQDQPPPQPPRPQVDVSRTGPSINQEVETPTTKSKRQRKEHYQIKHIRWYDPAKRGIRHSPILIQNANGPCPLLALVNALVLSTPATEETALVETLRTREQVSLGLLLDAVFDELMSGRRGEAAQELPDVGDLYSFLVTLHTGMNVNPSFVRVSNDLDIVPFPIPHPALRDRDGPGGFEDTKEMRLYSTFNIPLIHGWLPQQGTRAYDAFNRVARTYEGAQQIQFQEEELEAKLRSQGLNEEEQKLFEDLHAIKEFLVQWPTQLTDHGLQVMTKNLKPGQFAILFRNDHFSTLYKEPRSEQMVTLVTDAGYASHEEIVWETLVDVNGQDCELYSGDFRPVGNMSEPVGRPISQERPIRSLLDIDDDQGWTTIQSRNNRPNQRNSGLGHNQHPSTASTSTIQAPRANLSQTEQEDHDLALALQLQEEEDDRHRRELAERQRRENELSTSFLEQQRTQGGPQQNIRPLVPPRRPQPPAPSPNREDPPPPTYEQAASTQPYHPPQGHPANPNAPTQPPRQGSAYGQMASHFPPGAPQNLPHRPGRPNSQVGGLGPHTRPGRRTSGVGTGPGGRDEEKCIVM